MGRRGAIIGVGSFSPTGVTPEEIGDLVARLRRQADDLVIVAPATRDAAPWGLAADIRLLTWDRLGTSEASISSTILDLRMAEIIVDSIVGFGVEEYDAVQRLTPVEDVSAGSVAPGGPELVGGDFGQSPPADDAVAAASGAEAGVSSAARRRPTSVTRFAAVVAIVAIAALGWVIVNGKRGSRPVTPSHRPAVEREQTSAPASSRSDASSPPSTNEVPPPAAGETPQGSGQPPATSPQTSEPGADQQAAATAAKPTPTVREAERPASPREEPASSRQPTAGAFDPTPYQGPVGEAGWALWLYSHPNQDAADAEIRGLRQAGYQAVSRPVDLPDKGRWYRIYVGNFPNRAAAEQAAPALLVRLHHHWAQPTRF